MKANVRRLAVVKRNELMQKRNVVGVMAGKEHKAGQKTDRDAVVVLVQKKIDVSKLDKNDLVPRRFIEFGKEIPTDVIEVGKIKALHKDKHRPIIPGTSVGHNKITAGTLGIVVEKNNDKFILSNNHVLANENDAAIGDSILQPGPSDGGKEEDKVAELSEFIPIDFDNENLVDAALAKLIDSQPEDPEDPPVEDPPVEDPDDNLPEDNDFLSKIFKFIENIFKKLLELLGLRKKQSQTFNARRSASEGNEYVNEPLNLGPITKQLREVMLGDVVKKSGRTTGVTVDEVIGIDASANVSYGNGVALFVDQIICGPMSRGGDSGSVVYDESGNAVGLLFAGSNTVTIVNRIQNVFNTLEIDKIS